MTFSKECSIFSNYYKFQYIEKAFMKQKCSIFEETDYKSLKDRYGTIIFEQNFLFILSHP